MGIRRCTFHSNGTFFCTLFLQPTTSDIGIRGGHALTLCHQGLCQMLLAVIAATYLYFNKVQCGAVVLVRGSKNPGTQKTSPLEFIESHVHQCCRW